MLLIRMPDGVYLLENNLLAPPSSCDGEPAPDRVFPAIFPEFRAPRKGDLKALPFEPSVGDVLAVEDPERGIPADGWGR